MKNSTDSKKGSYGKRIIQLQEEKKQEFFPKQKASFFMADWKIYLSLDEINNLEKGVTTVGRHLCFFYDSSVHSHGFSTTQNAYSQEFIETMKHLHSKSDGFSLKDFQMITQGMRPAPIAVKEMKNEPNTFSLNYKNKN